MTRDLPDEPVGSYPSRRGAQVRTMPRRRASNNMRHGTVRGRYMIAADWFGGLAQNIVTSALFLATGYLVGHYRERRRLEGKPLTEYDFYPYAATAERFAEFSLK